MTQVMKRNEKRPEVLAENEKIKENRQKYGTKVHKFKSAHWTHPNGHPRCILCGQEESISPECNREPTAEEHAAFQEKLSAEFSTNTFDVSPDGELKKAHFDPSEPRDRKGKWVKVGNRLVRVAEEDVVPALGRGRSGRVGSGNNKVAGKAAAKKKKVAQRIPEPEVAVDPETESSSDRRRRLRAEADKILEENKNVQPGSPKPAAPRRSRKKVAPTPPPPESVDVTAASRAKVGTLGDATHQPIKPPTRNQIAAAKQHIRDNVKKRDEAYAGLVLRLASRGRVQSPEMRAAAADKYGRSKDDLYAIERDVYTALFGAAPERVRDHHTIADAPKRARDAMKAAGATHAMPSPSSDDFVYQDREGKWHLVDAEGDVVDLSTESLKEAVVEKMPVKDLRTLAQIHGIDETKRDDILAAMSEKGLFDYSEAEAEVLSRVKVWGDIARADLSDDEKRRITAFNAARDKAHRNMTEEQYLHEMKMDFLKERMEALGLDYSDPNQRRAFLGKLGVQGELHDASPSVVTRRDKRKVALGAADTDKKNYRGHKPEKGKDTIMDGGTTAKSPRTRRVQKSLIHKHGDPDTTPPEIYHAMHPGGRKTKWVKNSAQVERDHAAGWKFVSGEDGRDLSVRQAKAKVGTGGKPVYAYKPGADSPTNATARDRRKAKAVATSGEPKKKITRARVKNEGAPEGFRDMTTKDMERMQARGYKVPPKWSNLYINENGPNKELLYVGTDEAGRRQYRYTKEWRASRNGGKFNRVAQITERMPKLDAALKKEKNKNSVAGAVALVRLTGMRPDTGRDTKAKVDAVGVTSLEVQHVKISGNKVTFDFIGKKGVHNNYTVVSPELAALMRNYTDGKAPGDKVFPNVRSSQMNAYLKQHLGMDDAVVKDLRTYVGTTRAIEKIRTMPVPKTKIDINKARKAVAEYVAYFLSNDPAEAQSSYIDQTVYSVWGL